MAKTLVRIIFIIVFLLMYLGLSVALPYFKNDTSLPWWGLSLIIHGVFVSILSLLTWIPKVAQWAWSDNNKKQD